MNPRRFCALLPALLLAGCAAQQRLSWLEVDVDAPARVEAGGEAELVLSIRNTGAEPVKVVDVDVQRSLLKAIDWRLLAPVAADGVELREYRVHRVDSEVPAGGTLEVRFSLLGLHEADVRGDIDVCVDNFHCLTEHIRIEVIGWRARRPARRRPAD